MDVLQKLDLVIEGKRPHKGKSSYPGGDYPEGHPSRGSGPSTRHESLGGKKSGRGEIWKRTVISPGTRSSGRGMKAGDVSYSRTTDKPRGGSGPLSTVPLSKPAPIEGRVRDVVRSVKKGGHKAVGAVKKLASRIRGKKSTEETDS